MKVYVNDMQVELHRGATVGDAVRRYYSEQGQQLPSPVPVVRDDYGNEVAYDGALEEGSQLHLVKPHAGSGKRRLLSLLLLAGVSLFASCGTTRQTVTPPLLPRAVQIVAVNDMHAAMDNFPRFAFMVDSLRTLYPELLLLSGGDHQTGNPANDQYVPKGRPIVLLMNRLGFDFTAVGNHEFDTGETFPQNRAAADFDFICSNLTQPEDGTPPILPYKIITQPNGARLAFASLLYLNEHGIPDSHPANLEGYTFHDPLETAQSLQHLRDSADIFIYLNHLGFNGDVRLANSLPAGMVDLIIGAHSHTKVDTEQLHNGTLITQAQNKLRYLTLHHLILYPDGTVSKRAELLPIEEGGQEDLQFRQLVDEFNDNALLKERLAHAVADFTSKEQLGYLMVDALRGHTGADIAIVNPGGVRISHLPAGDVTVMDVYTMDPFGNEIILYNLTGHELRALMLNGWELDARNPIFPSGITTRYTVNGDRDLLDVQLFTEEGEPLDLDREYKVAMNGYAATVYKYEHKDPGTSLYRSTAEGTIDYLRQLGTIPSYQGVSRVSSSVK